MTKGEDKELDLYRNILRGDMVAMKEFYDLYSGYLAAICSRYIANKDDVRDILQESFIKIFGSIRQFEYRGVGSLKGWAARITVNESLKYIRENERLNMIVPTDEIPDIIENKEPDFDDIPMSIIMDMIRSLPTGYRTVFNLYVFEKKNHKEIASILNIAENSSASQFHRAKNALAEKIKEYRSTKMIKL